MWKLDQAAFFRGPQPLSRNDRLQIVDQIKQMLIDMYGDSLIAIGLSGSLARERDQPYSDIDMFAVVDQLEPERIEISWHHDACKIDGNVYSDTGIRQKVVMVDVHWPLRGGFLYVQPVYGDARYFENLKALKYSVPQAKLDEQIAIIISGHYEAIGKFRNAKFSRQTTYLAQGACTFAEFNALMLGLAHRVVYTTGQTMLTESMAMEHRPDGHDALCKLVISGRLNDPNEIMATVERAWAGIERWIDERNLDVGPYLGQP